MKCLWNVTHVPEGIDTKCDISGGAKFSPYLCRARPPGSQHCYAAFGLNKMSDSDSGVKLFAAQPPGGGTCLGKSMWMFNWDGHSQTARKRLEIKDIIYFLSPSQLEDRQTSFGFILLWQCFHIFVTMCWWNFDWFVHKISIHNKLEFWFQFGLLTGRWILLIELSLQVWTLQKSIL